MLLLRLLTVNSRDVGRLVSKTGLKSHHAPVLDVTRSVFAAKRCPGPMFGVERPFRQQTRKTAFGLIDTANKAFP